MSDTSADDELRSAREELEGLEGLRPFYGFGCSICEAAPIVPDTGLCGPCTWGESRMRNGCWWTEEQENRLSELRGITTLRPGFQA